MKISQDKKGRWKIDFRCKGRRIIKIVGTSKREAEAVAASIKTDILRDPYGFGRKKPEILFEDHAREFLELYSKQNKRSWKSDKIHLERLITFFKDKYLSEIGPEAIEKYRIQRKAEGVSPSTINRELSCLKTCFKKAIEWKKAEENPARMVKKFREPKGRLRILTADETNRLLAAASPTLQPVLIVALNTGARLGEILSLRWEDADFVKGIIFIADSKSGKARKIPMNGLVFEALRGIEKRADAEFIFENPKTKTHTRSVRTAYNGALERAGIKGACFHTLRHTALSGMLEMGASIITVRDIAGHSSVLTTQRYLHAREGDDCRAVEKLGEYFKETGKEAATIEIRPPVSSIKSFN